MIYVVVACHLESAGKLCKTTIARLEKAFELTRDGSKIIVTGDVPYERATHTLGTLMRRWLIRTGSSPDSVVRHEGGVGTFSEARLVCHDLKRGDEITVVSSPWYLFQAKPIWRRRARENAQKIHFVSVKGTGGIRTWVTYIGLGLLIRVFTILGKEKWLEDRLTVSQEIRRYGFTLDGCR